MSNAAATMPITNVLCQLGAGNVSTGISEAAATSAIRNTAPVDAGHNTFQSGLRISAVTRIAAQSPSPSAGTRCSSWGAKPATPILVATSATSIAITMPIRDQSSTTGSPSWGWIGS